MYGDEYQGVINRARLDGFVVHESEEEDDPDSTSLISPEFVKFFRENGRSGRKVEVKHIQIT
jgi:hypothetical protein